MNKKICTPNTNNSPTQQKFSVKDEHIGNRIDSVIPILCPELTRSQIQKLIADGNVTINSSPVKKNHLLKSTETIIISIPKPITANIQAEDIPIHVVYEDNDLMVINKPKGMVIHPAPGHYSKTLVNAIMFHTKGQLSGINGIIRPGIVHRIDKNTSGLIIVAKSDFAHHSLATQIKEHSFSREYEAIVYGKIKDSEGIINAPIGRNKINRKKMSVTCESSRQAITYFRVIKQYDNFAHVRLILKTGRTHQIRVHMAYINHPVAGDDVYGPKKVITSLHGQCLHAKHIGFVHPRNNQYLEFESDLPEYFRDFLKTL